MAIMKNGKWRPTEDAESLSTIDRLDNLKGAEAGRVTVPVIWDKHTSKVVSHESGDVAQWLATQWPSLTDNPISLVPEDKQSEITDLCA